MYNPGIGGIPRFQVHDTGIFPIYASLRAQAITTSGKPMREDARRSYDCREPPGKGRARQPRAGSEFPDRPPVRRAGVNAAGPALPITRPI
jgi:hypothetical protein